MLTLLSSRFCRAAVNCCHIVKSIRLTGFLSSHTMAKPPGRSSVRTYGCMFYDEAGTAAQYFYLQDTLYVK